MLRRFSDAHGLASIQQLAGAMGVSEALVTQMIDHAVALGFLETTASGCGKTGCSNCSLRGMCAGAGTVQMWSITERGRAVIGEG